LKSAALHAKVRAGYGCYEVNAKPMNSGGSSSFWFHKGDTPGWRTQIDVSASLHVFVRVAAVAASPLRADYS